jgi:hypothetical protein
MGIIRQDENKIKETIERKEKATQLANQSFIDLRQDIHNVLQKYNAAIYGACCDPEYKITIDGFDFTFNFYED